MAKKCYGGRSTAEFLSLLVLSGRAVDIFRVCFLTFLTFLDERTETKLFVNRQKIKLRDPAEKKIVIFFEFISMKNVVVKKRFAFNSIDTKKNS